MVTNSDVVKDEMIQVPFAVRIPGTSAPYAITLRRDDLPAIIHFASTEPSVL